MHRGWGSDRWNMTMRHAVGTESPDVALTSNAPTAIGFFTCTSFHRGHAQLKCSAVRVSTANPILAWGWHGLTPTILSNQTKSTKSTKLNRVDPGHILVKSVQVLVKCGPSRRTPPSLQTPPPPLEPSPVRCLTVVKRNWSKSGQSGGKWVNPVKIGQNRSNTGQKKGEGWFINSQTRPLHASEEDATRRQGSESP